MDFLGQLRKTQPPPAVGDDADSYTAREEVRTMVGSFKLRRGRGAGMKVGS